MYRSKILDKIWGLGDCLIGEANFESMAYTARYTLKKQVGKNAGIYTCLGIEPEFARMSRGGREKGSRGISGEWIDKYLDDVFPHDFCVGPKNSKISPPIYYKRKLETVSPSTAIALKVKRQDEAERDPTRNTPQRLYARAAIARARFNDFMRDVE